MILRKKESVKKVKFIILQKLWDQICDFEKRNCQDFLGKSLKYGNVSKPRDKKWRFVK